MIFLGKGSLQLEMFSFATMLATLIPVLGRAADSSRAGAAVAGANSSPAGGECLDPRRSNPDRVGESS